MTPPDHGDWYPIRIFCEDDGWVVDWCRFDGLAFGEPFFHQTVARALERPFNRALRRVTPLEERNANANANADERALAPNGFIFHVSRCGSTLIAQAFAALADAIVLSEAGPIDEILRASRHDPGASEGWRAARMRELVTVYGRRRAGHERRFVVKLDPWHSLESSTIERAFPDTPRVFVIRDPIEVMVSHARLPAWMMSAVNAPALLGCTLDDAIAMPREECHARILGRLYEAAIVTLRERDLVVDYTELPGAIVERIAPHVGIVLDEGERDRIARSVRFDAKQPAAAFVRDGPRKRAEADDAIRASAERFVMPAYRRLVELRRRRR